MKRDEILLAYSKLKNFLESVESISVEEALQISGLSRATFYRTFQKNKLNVYEGKVSRIQNTVEGLGLNLDPNLYARAHFFVTSPDFNPEEFNKIEVQISSEREGIQRLFQAIALMLVRNIDFKVTLET